MMRLLVVAALAVGLAMPVWGQDFDAGLAAYERGDYAAALKEFRPLAEQGDAAAQTFLGVMYENGEIVPQDDAEAARWYRLAAEQGFSVAQMSLGLMYYNGRGVPQDDAEAMRWYRLAAEQGDADAQTGLGFMYDNGTGVPQDYVQAHMWFNLAASGGNEDGRGNRDTVAQQMTPAQIAEAQRLAREWLEKHER